jgi:hypothetical protein
MDRQKDALLKRTGMPGEEFWAILNTFADFPNNVPKSEVEVFAKQYMIYSTMMNRFILNQFDQEKLGNRSKYGKLMYTYRGGVLEIISRYDTGIHGANYSLYRGRLLSI